MSLTFQGEHLAWQQRVVEEKTKSTNFNRTFGAFASPKDIAGGNRWSPRANRSEYASNYFRHIFDYKQDLSSVATRKSRVVRRLSDDEYLKFLDKKIANQRPKRRSTLF